MLPQPVEDVWQLTPAAQGVSAGQELLEGDVFAAADDAVYNVPSFTAGVLSGNRENAVLHGLPRTAYDVVADYDGEWGGMEDSFDLPGPSFDWDGNWMGWNSDQAQDDPLRPANYGMLAWAAVAAIVIGVGAYLLRPVFGLLENATEDEA